MTIRTIASGSSGNAYLVGDGMTTVLIECGLAFDDLQRGADFDLASVRAVLISHRHKDHSKALRDCLRAGMDCYAPQDVFDKIKRKNRRCHATTHLKSFEIGTFLIVPFDLDHDVPNHGFLLHSRETAERLMYFTDTFDVAVRFDGVTHLMVECNHSRDLIADNIRAGTIPMFLADRIRATHMSLERLLCFFDTADLQSLRECHIIHVSKQNGNAAMFRAMAQRRLGEHVKVF